MGAHLSKVMVIVQGLATAAKAKSMSEVWLDLQICQKSAVDEVFSKDLGSCCKKWPEAPIPGANFAEMCQSCEHSSGEDESCEHIYTESYGVRISSGHYDPDSCSKKAVTYLLDSDHVNYVCLPSCDPFLKTKTTKKLCERYWTRWDRPSKEKEESSAGKDEEKSSAGKDEEEDGAEKEDKEVEKDLKSEENAVVALEKEDEKVKQEDDGEVLKESKQDKKVKKVLHEEESAIEELKEDDKKVKAEDDKDVLKEPDNVKKWEKKKEDVIGDLGKAVVTDIEKPKRAWKDLKKEAEHIEKEVQYAWKEANKPGAVQRASKGLAASVENFGKQTWRETLLDMTSLARKHTVFFSAVAVFTTGMAITLVAVRLGLVEKSTVFDLGTAGLMIADVASDVYVARKYWLHAVHEGSFPIFFTISVCILLVSSTFGLVYVLAFEQPKPIMDTYSWIEENVFKPLHAKLKALFGGTTKADTAAGLFLLFIHAVIFVLLIPLGSVLPIVTYLRGRFCIDEGKEKELYDKIKQSKEEEKVMAREKKVLSDRLKSEDEKLKPRMENMKALTVRMTDNIGLIWSRDEKDLQSDAYVKFKQELQDKSTQIAARVFNEEQTKKKRAEVDSLGDQYYNLMSQGGGGGGFGFITTFGDDQRKKIVDVQAKLTTARADLEKLMANQDGVFKSEALGYWVSGHHAQQCIELAQKLEEATKNAKDRGAVLDYIARLTNPDYPEYVQKRLNAVKDAEKQVLLARCRSVPLITLDADETVLDMAALVQEVGGLTPTVSNVSAASKPRYDISPEDATLQEEICARFIAQVKPAMDSGQAELDELQNAVNEVVVNRNSIVTQFLAEMQADAKTGTKRTRNSISLMRSEMDKKTADLDATLAPMRKALWEKQDTQRQLKMENQRWQKVLTERRDNEADALRYKEWELGFKTDEVFSLEIMLKMKTHLPFYVETILESIPQSLTQTSALVIYGHKMGVSYISIFSIATSIASIMSKVYVLCKSKQRWVFVYKFLCGCHDIALMFYTISALFQLRRGDEEGVNLPFMTRPVDYWSSLWIWQSFILGCEIWIVGFVCLFVLLCIAIKDSRKDIESKYGLGAYFGGVLCMILCWIVAVFLATIFCMIPIMVVMQAIRMCMVGAGWGSLLDLLMDMDDKADSKDMVAFITKGFNHVVGKAANEKDNAIAMLKWISNNDGEPTDPEMENFHKPVSRLQKVKNACGFAYGRVKRICALIPLIMKTMDEARKKPISTATGSQYTEEVLKFVAAVMAGIASFIVVVTWYIGVFYSFAYPFLSFQIAVRERVYHGKEMNMFQTFLFTIYASFLIAVIIGQFTIQNNYLAVLSVIVPVDELLGDIHDQDDSAKQTANQTKNKKRQERIKKYGKEGFDNMWEKYFCKQAGDNFRIEHNNGCCASCRELLCCWPTEVEAKDGYELLGQEDPQALTEAS